MTSASSPSEEERVGLCLRCRHHRRVDAKGGSVFFLCRLSATDPSFQKYPPLPVIRCPGYELVSGDALE